MMHEIILISHVAATLCMTGIIWFVQVVHYPLFALIGEQEFARYEEIHQRKTTYVVLPLMVTESVTAICLLFSRADVVSRPEAICGFVLVLIIWLSTALAQVPQHQKLAKGFQESAHRYLVVSNWIRTLAWTVRGGLVLLWVSRLI